MYVTILRSKKSGERSRAKARESLIDLSDRDVVTEFKTRSSNLLEKATLGLPGGGVGSQELERLLGQARRYVASDSAGDHRRFLVAVLPRMMEITGPFRTQYKELSEEAQKYRGWFSECQYSARDSAIKALNEAKEVADQEIVACPQVLTDQFSDPKDLDDLVKRLAARLPVSESGLISILNEDLPKGAHAIAVRAAKKQANVSLETYARRKGAEQYLTMAQKYFQLTAVAQERGEEIPAHPCDEIDNSDRRKTCHEALDVMQFYVGAVKPATEQAAARLEACQLGSGYKSGFQPCMADAVSAYKSETTELKEVLFGEKGIQKYMNQGTAYLGEVYWLVQNDFGAALPHLIFLAAVAGVLFIIIRLIRELYWRMF